MTLVFSWYRPRKTEFLRKEEWLRASRFPRIARADEVVDKVAARLSGQPPRPRQSRNESIFLMARPPLLKNGGECSANLDSSVSKEGWPRPSSKYCEATSFGSGRVVDQFDNRSLKTTPSAPLRHGP